MDLSASFPIPQVLLRDEKVILFEKIDVSSSMIDSKTETGKSIQSEFAMNSDRNVFVFFVKLFALKPNI